MARNPEAYVDTSPFIAFLDKSDTYHPLFKRLFAAPPRLVTTPLVVAEGQAWFLRRYDSTRALQFMSMVETLSPLSLPAVAAPELAAAASLLRKFSDQSLTLTDALGLHVMHQRKIKDCWSTDFHLGLTGASLAIRRGH